MAKKKGNTPELGTTGAFLANNTLVALVLGIFAFLLYAKTIGFGYALDDVAVMYENEFVKKGFLGFGDILSTFYWEGNASFAQANSGLFRPISLLLFATEWQFAPNSPAFYHFVQVLLYALTIYVLYRFLRELLREFSPNWAMAVCLLFVVHGSHTEVVANIKSADEILALLFSLLSMRMLLRMIDREKKTAAFWAAIYFLLALLSKEGAVTMLPIMLLMLVFFRQQKMRGLFFPTACLLAATLIWIVWHTAVIQNSPAEPITYTYHDNTLIAAHSFSERLGTALSMVVMYLQKLIVPYPLSYDYAFPQIELVGIFSPMALLGLALLLGFIFACWKYYKTHPVLVWGILLLLFSFALTSNLFVLIGATMADRFMFLPSLGFAIACMYLLMRMQERFKNALWGGAIVLIAISFLITWNRMPDWENNETLFAADVAHAPESARVNYNYGTSLLGTTPGMQDPIQKKQTLETCIVYLKKAHQLDSADTQSSFNLGVAHYRLKDYTNSLYWSRKVRKLKPDDKTILPNMADAFTMKGDFDSAIVYLNQTIANGIIYKDTRNFLGYAYLNKGDTIKAIAALADAVKYDSTYTDAWIKYANVLGMHKEFERSNAAFEKILKLNPADPSPLKMIATNFLAQGDSVTASKWYSQYLARGGK
ncbi:MAG: glycosyltransferase family 39 protein [Bacteroidia bacterium]